MKYYVLQLYHHKQLGQYGAEYYKGGTYNFSCERYAIFTDDIREAKRYSSYNRANNALEKVIKRCINTDDSAKVVEVEE